MKGKRKARGKREGGRGRGISKGKEEEEEERKNGLLAVAMKEPQLGLAGMRIPTGAATRRLER
jgi:hypothetical protein